MEKERIKDSVERLRLKAELFLKKDIKAFIIDIFNNYYFCDILVVGEDYLYVKNFIGKRKGENDRILWYDILKIDEYKQEGFEHNKKEGGEDDSN